MIQKSGKVILEAIPKESDRKKIVIFLTRISKNASTQQILERISSLPVVLAKNIPREKGAKLVLQLNQMGARARFVTASSPETAKPRPLGEPALSKAEKGDLAKSGAAVGQSAVKTQPGVKTPPAEKRHPAGKTKPAPKTAARPGVKAAKTTPRKPKAGSRGRWIKLFLPICLVLAVALFFFTSGRFYLAPLSVRFYEWLPLGSDVGDRTPSQLDAPIDSARLFHDFDLAQTASYDKRLAGGMKQAFVLYMNLFFPDQPVTVETTADQVDFHRHKLTYTVKALNRTDQYSLVLSTKSGKVKDNLRAMEAVMGEFIRKMTGQKDPFSAAPATTGAALAHISGLIADFDYQDLFNGIQYIENHLVSKKEGPGLLLASGEIFSWLAFFKNSNTDPELSDALAVCAVSNYLTGAVFGLKRADISRYEGLLYLALDYPLAARRVLNTENMAEKLLAAFIEYDFHSLHGLLKRPGINRRLLRYLTARAYETSRQYNEANKEFARILAIFPDFLAAIEYMADNGSVGTGRRATPAYLTHLLKKQMDMTHAFFVTDWTKNDAQINGEMRQAASGKNGFLSWLKINSKTIDGSVRLKGKGRLLTADFLKRFLKMDMANALVIWFDLNMRRLGLLPESLEVVEIAENTYPDSQVAKALRLRYLLEFKKVKEILGFAAKINSPKAGRYLIKQMLHSYFMWKSNVKNAPQILALLKRYKDMENPNATGLYGLFYFYGNYYHMPYFLNYLKAALETNPYDYSLYSAIKSFEGSETYFKTGESYLKHSYGFLTTAAHYYIRKGQTEKGISLYNKAIKINPSQVMAYEELGEVYKDQKEYGKAISIWQKYLKYDDHSLSGVAIRNAIGRAYLEKKQYAKAYAVFEISKESYQNSALIGFAEASEKTGKIGQAEAYYLKALERYPHSDKTTAFTAFFYLRQNNPKAACDVLRKHKKYHHYSYFYRNLIGYFAENGQPEQATKIVYDVENGKPSIWVIYNLAEAYAQKSFPKIALELYEPIMKNMKQPRKNRPYLFASLYLKYCASENTCHVDEKLSELISLYAKIPPMIEQLGIGLIGNENFDAALKAFDAKYTETSNRRDVALTMMALSWRLGTRPPLERKKIRKRLRAFKKDPWIVDKVKFLMGDMNVQTILSLAKNRDRQCEIHYYLGLMRKSRGEIEDARKHLLSALYTKAVGNIEYYYALEALKKLH